MRAKEKLAEKMEADRRRAWTVIRFALIPLAAVLGIGIGIKFPNIFKFGQGSTKPSTELSSGSTKPSTERRSGSTKPSTERRSGSTKPSTERHSGVRVQLSEHGKPFFKILYGNDRVKAYKYTGGDVEFWIELERDEKQVEPSETKQKTNLKHKFAYLDAPDSNQTIEGYFVWTRGPTDESGHENWRVGFHRVLVSTQSLEGIWEETGSSLTGSSPTIPIQIWKRKKPEGGSSGTLWGRFGRPWQAFFEFGPVGSIKGKQFVTLPTDQEVVIQTTTHYRYEKDKLSPEGKYEKGPLYEKVVLRVMCKVAKLGKTEKGETPGQ